MPNDTETNVKPTPGLPEGHTAIGAPIDMIQWEIDNGAYYNPVPPKIPQVDTLLGAEVEIDGMKYWEPIEGDESVPGQTRSCPTPGCQPEGYPEGSWWAKVSLPDGRVMWKLDS